MSKKKSKGDKEKKGRKRSDDTKDAKGEKKSKDKKRKKKKSKDKKKTKALERIAEEPTWEEEPAQPTTPNNDEDERRAYRVRLHERLMLLREKVESGEIKFHVSQTDLTDSLVRVRLAPDGLVDLDSVAPEVRALAMVTEHLTVRQRLLEVPLVEVQQEYFKILDLYFGHIFREMRKNDGTPAQAGAMAANTPSLVEAMIDTREEFLANLRDFWEANGPIVTAHLQELRGITSVFGGDLFPSYRNNIVSSSGLYVDTIVLPDPLLKGLAQLHMMSPERQVFYTVKHAVNALIYKDLALAELSPPILVIAPEESILDEDTHRALVGMGTRDAKTHLETMFGRTFNSLDDARVFAAKLSTQADLLAQLRRPERLLFDEKWEGTPAELLERAIAEQNQTFDFLHEQPAGETAFSAAFGRMMQANTVVQRAQTYRGVPLIDAPTSWRYLLWKYEYDLPNFDPTHDKTADAAIVHGLTQYQGRRAELIHGLKPAEVLRLRKEGALEGLRTVVASGIEELRATSDLGSDAVVKHVLANIDDAFAAHEKELTDLRTRKRKFYGLDVTGFLGNTAFGVAASLTGYPELGVASYLAGTIGLPNLKDLKKTEKELKGETQRVNNSPIAMLIRAAGSKK